MMLALPVVSHWRLIHIHNKSVPILLYFMGSEKVSECVVILIRKYVYI